MVKENKPKKVKEKKVSKKPDIVLTETEDDILGSTSIDPGELKAEIIKDSKKSDMLSRFLVPLFTFFFITILASFATWYYAKPEKRLDIPKEEKIQTPPEVKEDEPEEDPVNSETEVPEKRETSYTIQEGDTLSTVANANGLTSQELASYNGITDPNSLRIGQVIKIPVK